MQIKIYSKFGEKFAPIRAEIGSVGYDLVAPRDIYLPHGCECMVDTGIVVDLTGVERKLYTELRLRSSTGHKHSIMLKTTTGVIDPSYCGPEDTIKASLFRLPLMEKHLGTFVKDPDLASVPVAYRLSSTVTDYNVYSFIGTDNKEMISFYEVPRKYPPNNLVFKEGERFAQLLFVPYEAPMVKIVQKDELKPFSRGGIGSTGK